MKVNTPVSDIRFLLLRHLQGVNLSWRFRKISKKLIFLERSPEGAQNVPWSWFLVQGSKNCQTNLYFSWISQIIPLWESATSAKFFTFYHLSFSLLITSFESFETFAEFVVQKMPKMDNIWLQLSPLAVENLVNPQNVFKLCFDCNRNKINNRSIFTPVGCKVRAYLEGGGGQ